MRDPQQTIGSLRNRLKRKMNLSDLDDRQVALDNLLDTANATDEHVMTKDTATGKAIFKAAAGGGGGDFTFDGGTISGTSTGLVLDLCTITDPGLILDFGGIV